MSDISPPDWMMAAKFATSVIWKILVLARFGAMESDFCSSGGMVGRYFRSGAGLAATGDRPSIHLLNSSGRMSGLLSRQMRNCEP